MNNLKIARKKAGYTQKQVGEILGVTQNAYHYWEAGKIKLDGETVKKLAELFDTTTDYLLGGKESKKAVRIPVLGRVPAGVPIEAIEEVLDWEEIPAEQAKHGEYFALRVRGDSMEPRICDGDVLIVRKQSTADTGDIVIALINGDDATVKRLKRTDNGIMLVPNNMAYDPMAFSNEEIIKLPVEIVGVVVENRQKYK